MKKALFVLALLAAVSFGTKASAETIIDFGPGLLAGGTITVTSTAASGTDLAIGAVQLQNTPNYTFQIFEANALMNFDTAQNFINIIGTVPGLGITTPQTLLSGTIANWTWNSGLKKLELTGIDTKSADLLTAAGLPVDTKFAYYMFDIYGSLVPGTENTYIATSYDIRNTAVPEPASMLLLGSGLFGLAAAARRRFKK